MHQRPHRELIASFFVLILAGPACTGPADKVEDTLRQAEQAFQRATTEKADPAQARKLFAEAAKGYASLHSQGVRNADLYLDWGNAELLAGHVPRAILAFRRGLRLAPGRGDLAKNLQLALEQVVYPPTAHRAANDTGLSLLPRWLDWLPMHARLLLCLAAFVLFTLAWGALLAWWVRRPSWLPGQSLVLFLAAALCAYWWHQQEMDVRRDRGQPLVVIAQETNLSLGNGPSYPSHSLVPTLNPGMEGRRLAQRGDWLQIELPGGVVGWVPGSAAFVDEP